MIPFFPGEIGLLMQYSEYQISNTLSCLFRQHSFWNVFHFDSIYFRSGCVVSIALRVTQVSWDIDGKKDFNPIAVNFLVLLTT